MPRTFSPRAPWEVCGGNPPGSAAAAQAARRDQSRGRAGNIGATLNEVPLGSNGTGALQIRAREERLDLTSSVLIKPGGIYLLTILGNKAKGSSPNLPVLSRKSAVPVPLAASPGSADFLRPAAVQGAFTGKSSQENPSEARRWGAAGLQGPSWGCGPPTGDSPGASSEET